MYTYGSRAYSMLGPPAVLSSSPGGDTYIYTYIHTYSTVCRARFYGVSMVLGVLWWQKGRRRDFSVASSTKPVEQSTVTWL